MRHEHVEGTYASNITKHSEEDAVPAGLSVIDSELLAISEKFGVLLNECCAFQTDIKAKLLLSLD